MKIKALNSYIKMIDVINKIIGWLLAALLAIMSILIFWQVISRFIFTNPLTFSEEIARILMVWITLLGSGYAVRKGSLLAVEILPEIVNEKVGKIIKITSSILSLFFYFILVIYGWEMAINFSYQYAAATGISMFWAYISFCSGGILMVLNTFVVMIEEFK